MFTGQTLPYTRGTLIPHLLGFKNYLNNYYAMYKRLTRSRIRVEFQSPAYLAIGVIQIIILPCIHV